MSFWCIFDVQELCFLKQQLAMMEQNRAKFRTREHWYIVVPLCLEGQYIGYIYFIPCLTKVILAFKCQN